MDAEPATDTIEKAQKVDEALDSKKLVNPSENNTKIDEVAEAS